MGSAVFILKGEIGNLELHIDENALIRIKKGVPYRRVNTDKAAITITNL